MTDVDVEKKSLWFKLMSYTTYPQKYYIVLAFLLVGYVFLFWNFVSQKTDDIDRVTIEIAGNQLEGPLRDLMEYLPEHNLLAIGYLEGDKAKRGELLSLQSKITETFRRLKAEYLQLESTLDTDVIPQEQEGNISRNPDEIYRMWDQLRRQVIDFSPEASQAAHWQLMNQITGLIHFIGQATGLALEHDYLTYYAMDIALNHVPTVQNHFSRVEGIAEAAIKNESLNKQQWVDLISSVALIQDALIASEQEVSQYYGSPTKNEDDYLYTLFSQYSSAVRRFTSDVNAKLILADSTSFTLPSFGTEADEVRQAVFTFWNAASEQLNTSLQERKSELYRELWIPLGISLLLGLTGFVLGLYFILTVVWELRELGEQTTRYKEGDLSARAKVQYEDEAGVVALAFNDLAAHFEGVLKELKHLLGSIQLLANGDFSVRVAIKDPDSEMGRVGQSFNQLAMSFGDVIGQLRELGINLATSATQITAASKQQELVITEQEATTREISVTANEISTTAKEFASTMNEVSHVADQTASLANTGKDSLTHMEETMGQMVNASGNIASKLAILNEKAGNITSVITTITKVADQTNLLSLNASIEAEKAGEFGKSFAVIAREIRRLADLTAYATLDIEKIVGEIMSAVNTSVLGVDEFTQEIRTGGEEVARVSEQLTTIIEQVQVLTMRFDSVNQGMQGQAIGAEQINDAIAQLNITAKETSSSLAGFRRTLQQLTVAASDLRGAVDKIKGETLSHKPDTEEARV